MFTDCYLYRNVGVSGFCLAIYQSLWAYSGYEAITWVTEEVKNPKRSIPIIIYCAVPLVVLLYLCVNIAFLTGMQSFCNSNDLVCYTSIYSL